jgi:hypothetical protein
LRKQSKRQVRPKVIPTMAFLYSVPDLEISILSAVSAFRDGYATPGQFDILLDTRDLLLLGAKGAKDEGVVEVARAINDVLAEIRESWDGTKFAPLNEDALNALNVLADVSNDFWKRKSGALYQAAYIHLKQWREKQNEDSSHERRAD